MGMLMHHTWQEQQKQKELHEKQIAKSPAEKPKPEPKPVKPVQNTRGRRKATK